MMKNDINLRTQRLQSLEYVSMDKLNLYKKFKNILISISWWVLLWASNMTQEEYLFQACQKFCKKNQAIKRNGEII